MTYYVGQRINNGAGMTGTVEAVSKNGYILILWDNGLRWRGQPT